jgi:CRISPR-associated protein Cas2
MQQSEFYIIVYDIENDRRRLKVAKLLEQVGERVQYSVFEAWLTKDELLKLVRRLERHIEPDEDSIRIYYLCASCREKTRNIGEAVIVPPPGVRIV